MNINFLSNNSSVSRPRSFSPKVKGVQQSQARSTFAAWDVRDQKKASSSYEDWNQVLPEKPIGAVHEEETTKTVDNKDCIEKELSLTSRHLEYHDEFLFDGDTNGVSGELDSFVFNDLEEFGGGQIPLQGMDAPEEFKDDLMDAIEKSGIEFVDSDDHSLGAIQHTTPMDDEESIGSAASALDFLLEYFIEEDNKTSCLETDYLMDAIENSGIELLNSDDHSLGGVHGREESISPVAFDCLFDEESVGFDAVDCLLESNIEDDKDEGVEKTLDRSDENGRAANEVPPVNNTLLPPTSILLSRCNTTVRPSALKA